MQLAYMDTDGSGFSGGAYPFLLDEFDSTDEVRKKAEELIAHGYKRVTAFEPGTHPPETISWDYIEKHRVALEAISMDLEHLLGLLGVPVSGENAMQVLSGLVLSGRVLVLPCAPGTMVSVITQKFDGYHVEQKKFQLGMASKWGKTVFPTPEDADGQIQKLKNSL